LAGAAVLLALLPMGVANAQAQEQAPLPSRALETQPDPQKKLVPLPLWEFGLGIGAVSFRDYRGSDTTHAYPVPVPYFIYRGEYLQADRSGLKSKLFHQDRVELNVSLNATTPVRNNATRAGMPQLRSTVEIGPSLDVHAWHSKSEDVRLDVRMPVRAVSAVGRPGYIGWFFAPNVNLDILNPGGFMGWNLGLLTGPLFAARRYDDYYYSVTSQYATPSRPAYQASGGYAGAQVLASLTKRYPKFWTGGYLRYDTLAGASFENSPLVKSHNYWSAGIGIAWMIGQSSRIVAVPESESHYEPCNGCSNH
jgi:outer membrane scaffolding protein for murein synthesis (MipA/OmpV family)